MTIDFIIFGFYFRFIVYFSKLTIPIGGSYSRIVAFHHFPDDERVREALEFRIQSFNFLS